MVLQDTVVVQVVVPTLVEGARNPAGGEVRILEEGNPVVVGRNLAVADLQRFNNKKKQIGLMVNYPPNRDSHWLILGHVALTKIKCIPIVIHQAMYPARDTLQHVIRAWWKVA